MMDWLERHQASGTTENEALAYFDSLSPVTLAEMIGRWKGSGFPTGHPLDGLLEAFAWYGKDFIDPESVRPLLFTGGNGRIFALDSRLIPDGILAHVNAEWRVVGLARSIFSLAGPLMRTTKPQARIRLIEHRGKVSAAMIYDFLPIVDAFRRVDADTLLGLMDLRGMAQPFFFILRRARSEKSLAHAADENIRMTFEEFYPEYLAAHADPRTRAVHAVGLLSGLTVGVAGLLSGRPKWIVTALALGYLPAFASHWIFEKNQPKTFEDPLNSLKGDFIMVYQLLTGALSDAKQGSLDRIP